MPSTRYRVLLFPALLLVMVLTSAVLYMLGMRYLEGDERTFWHAFEFAAETLSSTGYGADARWQHPVMIVFVVFLQFSGVFMVFLVFPFFLIPILEQRFEQRLPRTVSGLRDHVVIYHYSPTVETLIEQLERADIDFVVVEHEESTARRLLERKIPILWSDSPAAACDAFDLDEARAIVVNGNDEENAAVILVARQRGFDKDILALVEDPFYRPPMKLAGASVVFTPRHILAAAVAARASRRISPRIDGVQRLGGHLRIDELRIEPESELAGKTLAEADVGALTGATVIGQWVGGDLQTQPTAQTVIAPKGILIAVGNDESLKRLGDLTGASVGNSGPFVIAGYGEVGRKLAQMLTDAGEEVTIVDEQELDGVDLVGDILDPQVLERLDLDSAQAVILALDNDSATLFATVVLRDRAPEAVILARVNEAANVVHIRRAGADFALSISQVSGQMLAHRLLRRDSVALTPQLKVLRVADGRLGGHRLGELSLRERTGCSLVAVERGDRVHVSLDTDFELADDDLVYLCGSEQGIDSFLELYGID